MQRQLAGRGVSVTERVRDRGLRERPYARADARLADLERETHAADLARLRQAWPTHLASVRGRVFDHVDPGTVSDAAQALAEIAAQLEAGR